MSDTCRCTNTENRHIVRDRDGRARCGNCYCALREGAVYNATFSAQEKTAGFVRDIPVVQQIIGCGYNRLAECDCAVEHRMQQVLLDDGVRSWHCVSCLKLASPQLRPICGSGRMICDACHAHATQDSNKLGVTHVRNERSLYEPAPDRLLPPAKQHTAYRAKQHTAYRQHICIEEPAVVVAENKIVEPEWTFTTDPSKTDYVRMFHRLRVDVILANGKNFSDDGAPPVGWYARTAANLLAGLHVTPYVGKKDMGVRTFTAAPTGYPAVRGETRYSLPLHVDAGQELAFELHYDGVEGAVVPITFLRVVAIGRATRSRA